MKHRATIDLEFTNGDIFDQEVIKAMRAYAKTIAREAFQSEIQEAVVDTTRIWAKRLYESRYAEPMTDKLVRAIAKFLIEEGWVRAEPSADAKEHLMCLFHGHSIDTEKDIEYVAEMLLDNGVLLKG